MAYSAIPDTEIEPGKPGSSSLFTKMRDNPEAIAAGIDPAPKIANAAFTDNSLNGAKVVDQTIANAKITNSTIDFSAKMLPHNSSEVLWHVDNGSNYLIPKGIWIVRNTDNPLEIHLYDGTAWAASDASPLTTRQVIVSDGINMAFFGNLSGGFDVYARKIY